MGGAAAPAGSEARSGRGPAVVDGTRGRDVVLVVRVGPPERDPAGAGIRASDATGTSTRSSSPTIRNPAAGRSRAAVGKSVEITSPRARASASISRKSGTSRPCAAVLGADRDGRRYRRSGQRRPEPRGELADLGRGDDIPLAQDTPTHGGRRAATAPSRAPAGAPGIRTPRLPSCRATARRRRAVSGRSPERAARG